MYEQETADLIRENRELYETIERLRAIMKTVAEYPGVRDHIGSILHDALTSGGLK